MLSTDIRILGELEPHVLTAEASPGDIVFTRDGFAALIAGVNDGKAKYAAGDTVSVALDALVTLPKASGTTVADGVKAHFDTATKLVVTSASGTPLGAAFQTISTTRIRIRLNRLKLS